MTFDSLRRFLVVAPLLAMIALTPVDARAQGGAAPEKKPAEKKDDKDKDKDKDKKDKDDEEEKKDTPEAVARELMIAMLLQDKARVEAVIIPHKESKWLLAGDPVPPAARAVAEGAMKKVRFRRLKGGEVVKLPGGAEFPIPESEVTKDRVVLYQEGSPVPIAVQRIEGKWLVDPEPLIVARIMADRVKRGKQDEGVKTPLAVVEPEDAVREFVCAMCVGDQARIEAVTLPCEEREILWSRPTPEASQRLTVAVLLFAELRELAPGDKVTFPDGRSATVSEAAVSDDRVVLMHEDNPFPYIVVRQDGKWLVDARIYVPLRKAMPAAK